jgi:hypothetical protein
MKAVAKQRRTSDEETLEVCNRVTISEKGSSSSIIDLIIFSSSGVKGSGAFLPLTLSPS